MTHALVILCGGNSTRMGSDKALLPFGDCCLIEYLVKKFQPFFQKIYLSVKRKGDYAHLQLPVTEIPDIYPNAGPMSGVFSGLSMINENQAFFLSVDTPFLEPETGIALLEMMGEYDICMLRDNPSPECSTAAFSKNCITVIGKCLLMRQYTIQSLREKCDTKYLTRDDALGTSVPAEIQLFNLNTRQDYYHALHMLGGIGIPEASDGLTSYCSENRKPFFCAAPTLSFVSKPGIKAAYFIQQLVDALGQNGLDILYLTIEDNSVIAHGSGFCPLPRKLAEACAGCGLAILEYINIASCPAGPNKVEILKKGWSEQPITEKSELIAILADFPYRETSGIPVFDINRPREFQQFIYKRALDGM